MARKLKRVIEKADWESLDHESDKDLYEEKDGKYHFAAIELTDSQAEVARLRTESASLRVKNRDLSTKMETFKDLDADAVKQALVENESLKAEIAASGTKDKDKFETAVAARVKTETAPLQRKIDELSGTNTNLVKENEGHKAAGERRTKHDAMREACIKMKVAESAYAGKWPDALRWAEENAIIGTDGKITDKETGLPLDQALKNMQQDGQQQHWWGTSSGGGSHGSNGSGPPVTNPWHESSWNSTKQGEIYNKDPKKAEALARAAGVSVDAPFHPKLGPPKSNLYG
jgi:hypothetical protein